VNPPDLGALRVSDANHLRITFDPTRSAVVHRKRGTVVPTSLCGALSRAFSLPQFDHAPSGARL
jgi:hypothetical protein